MAAPDIVPATRAAVPVVRVATACPLALLTARPCPLAPPAPGEAAVWTFVFPPAEPVPPVFEAVLDAAERARADRLARARDRRLFVLAHGLARLVLAAWTGCDPAAVAFAVSEQGKPVLAGGGLAFNLSHAGNCALLAVTAGTPVGVDVEPLRPLPEAGEVAARFFAPEERLALAACPPSERDAAFLRLWTRKEAYVKALGGGLALSLADFAVSLEAPVRVLRPLPISPVPGPRLCDLPAPAGYVAALAGDFDRVVCRSFESVPAS